MSYEDRKSDAFREILRIVGRGKKLQRELTFDEAADAMRLLLSGTVSDAQIGAFLVTMRVKEETAEEISGFVQGARAIMQPFPKPAVEGLVDLVLPYNGKSRHLQTGVGAGMLLAAAGVPVLMHSADNVPTKNGIGVLNLLRTLGYPADNPPDAVRRSLEATNFGALNLDHLLPQWTALTPLRHHFGVRTLMNTVEKLLNPSDAPIHISGFFHNAYLTRLAQVLPGQEINWIIQGEEGSIDIRPGKKTRIYKASGADMVEIVIDANDYGFSEIHHLEAPVDPNAHAQAIRRALEGETGPVFDQIVLTAGVLLWLVESVADIETGIDRARRHLADGDTLAVLKAAQQVA